MRLEGMHHITIITGDANTNVAFYADVLGLRMVKKTVNFDAPEAYHLYFGDEHGSPGSILTWFEFAGARRRRAGAGMIHTIQLGVASEASLDFWSDRLAAEGYAGERGERSLTFEDYDALRFELVVAGVLFEIATTSPGFAVDEDPEHLGEDLRLPTQHEHLRPQLERLLTPLTNPRVAQRAEAWS